MLGKGTKWNEVLGVKWSAIDFKEKTICIKHTVCKTQIDGEDVIIAKDRTKNITVDSCN